MLAHWLLASVLHAARLLPVDCARAVRARPPHSAGIRGARRSMLPLHGSFVPFIERQRFATSGRLASLLMRVQCMISRMSVMHMNAPHHVSPDAMGRPEIPSLLMNTGSRAWGQLPAYPRGMVHDASTAFGPSPPFNQFSEAQAQTFAPLL